MPTHNITSLAWLLSVGFLWVPGIGASVQQASWNTSNANQREEEVPSFASYLEKIGEPPVLKAIDKDEAHSVASYRLIWASVYPKSEIVVLRLEIKKDGTGRLFTKATSTDGATVTLSKEDNVPIASANKFLEFVNKAGFWQISTREAPDPRVKDGTAWFLEGANGGRYHMVYRRTPEMNPGPLTDIGWYLAKDLANLDDSTIRIPRGDRSEPLRRKGDQ